MSEIKIKKSLKRYDGYKKCAICEKAYVTMLRISLFYPNRNIYLCKDCKTQLKKSIDNWDEVHDEKN